jgi:hypothetical protein
MMTVPGVLEHLLRGDTSCPIDVGVGDSLARDAVDHGVDALVWEQLATATGELEVLRRRLEPRVRAAVARDLLVQRELQAVLAALESARVDALVIKGTALAYSAYPHPWQRGRLDTDLMVRMADLPAAERALGERGYVRSHAISTGTVVSHQIALEKQDRNGLHHVLDLHWKIVNPHVLADALTFDDLWQRRQPAPALGSSAAVPSAVDSVLIASVHRLAHHQGHDRLIWLWDLKLLTQSFDAAAWRTLGAIAAERGIAGLCLDALVQAHDRLGAPLPDVIARELERQAPGEASHRYLEGPVHKRDVLESDLRALTSWRDRWRLVREHAFPPADFIRQRYGVRNRIWLPALYLHRLLVGAAKWVR